MTIQLTITYDSTTIDLMADGYVVQDGYYPETATDLNAQVSESIDVYIRGSSQADLAGKIRAINRAFEQARRHPTGPGGVYLNFALDKSLELWRSRISDGTVDLDSGLTRRWKALGMKVGVIVERAPWWEGPEAQLALSNPLDTANTDGLPVYNPRLHRASNTISFDSGTKKVLDSGNGLVDFQTGMTVTIEGSTGNDGTYTITDGGHAGYFVVSEAVSDEGAGANVGIDGPVCNYVEIAEGDVEGDLPAATRLEITNNFNSENRAYTIWIGQNVESDPGNLSHILEAEDASGETTVDSYLSSGNQYKDLDWSGAAENTLLTWTLSTELLNQLAGHYFRVIGKLFANVPAGLWVRLKVMMAATVLWDGPLTLLQSGSAELQELASLRLPPYLLGSGDLYPLTMLLNAKINSAGAHTFHIDYIQLTPLDGWRKLQPKGYGAGYEVRVVDDGIDGYLYTDGWTPAGKTGHYVGYGNPIMVQPGKLQRIYFLHNNMYGTAKIYRTLSVKIYYRPRRLTI